MSRTPTKPNNDDMPAEIDFSKGVRGKFYQPGMQISTPVDLQDDIQAWLAERAAARGIDVEQLVNELFKKNIEIIEATKQQLAPTQDFSSNRTNLT